MQVETYEVKETNEDGKIECDATAIALIESLGLEGQKRFLSGEEVSRCPYRKMTKEEYFIYRNLCTSTSELCKYDDGPIPLRVLQVAAHAREFFTAVEVWHPESADIKDPVLIGINKKGYDTEYFILARWGEVLETIENLRAIAANLFRTKHLAKLQEIYEEAEACIANVKKMSDAALANGKWSNPYWSSGKN